LLDSLLPGMSVIASINTVGATTDGK
jgi:hypothetical protein